MYRAGHFTEDDLQGHMTLIKYLIINKFSISTIDHRFDEYVGVGTIGLVKAYNKMDWSRDTKFSTFASTCIINEVISFMNKDKRSIQATSMDAVVHNDDSGELKQGDMIPHHEDFTKHEVDLFLNTLPNRDRELLQLSMLGYSQAEMSKHTGISQGYISKIIIRMREKYIEFTTGATVHTKTGRKFMDVVTEYSRSFA